MFNRFRQNEEGFTLVELLIVVVILSILAAIVVFAVGGLTDKAHTSANATDISIMQAAEESNYAQAGAYVGMAELVSKGRIQSPSTTSEVCLTKTTAAAYQILAVGTACPTGFVLAP